MARPPPPAAWGQTGLAVRPDRLVRFQYQIYASNPGDGAGACGANDPAAQRGTDIDGCMLISTFVPVSIFPNHWYVVVARGDLDGDGSAFSTIASAIDDSAIIKCNELE